MCIHRYDRIAHTFGFIPMYTSQQQLKQDHLSFDKNTNTRFSQAFVKNMLHNIS